MKVYLVECWDGTAWASDEHSKIIGVAATVEAGKRLAVLDLRANGIVLDKWQGPEWAGPDHHHLPSFFPYTLTPMEVAQ